MKTTKKVFKSKEMDEKKFSESERIKIASIYFAYGNKEVYKGLFQRGQMLAKGKIDPWLITPGIAIVEDKLNKKIDQDKYYREFIKPVTAFVTFKYQNGMERCINSFESDKNFFDGPIFREEKEYETKNGLEVPKKDKNNKQMTIKGTRSAIEMLGIPFECKEAPEPSNIIWENLQDSPKRMNQRKALVFVLLIVALGLIFTLLAFLKKNVVQLTKKYPEALNCNRLNIASEDHDIFEDFAKRDKPATDKFQGLGYFYCFCKKHSSRFELMKETLNKRKEEQSFCYDYQFDKANLMAINIIVVSLIAAFNWVLKKLNFYLIKIIGFSYESEEIMQIMTFVFYS